MKRFFAVFLLAGTSAFAQESSSKPEITTRTVNPAPKHLVMDIYGLATRDVKGGGFGMGVFSPAVFASPYGAELRFGGNMEISGIDRRTIKGVPLLAPQSGSAKVKLHESLFTLNAVARLSAPWNNRISPYVDGFLGLRVNSAGITVTPDQYQPGYEKLTDDNLDASTAFQYGGAAGLLIRLHPDIKLNLGVVYSRSEKPGTLSNIHSASVNNGAIVMDKKSLRQDMMMFRIGFTFRIDPTSNRQEHYCQCCGAHKSSRSNSVYLPSGGRSSAPNRVGTGVRVTK